MQFKIVEWILKESTLKGIGSAKIVFVLFFFSRTGVDKKAKIIAQTIS